MKLVVLSRKYVVDDRGGHIPRNMRACLQAEIRRVRDAVAVIENKDLL